jgi:hypothetical protein
VPWYCKSWVIEMLEGTVSMNDLTSLKLQNLDGTPSCWKARESA